MWKKLSGTIGSNRGQITDFTNIAHLNQRLSKTLADGSVVHYHHDESGRLWAETDGQGYALRDYVWMGDIPVAVVEYTGLTERVTYLHADHLNTPRYATDETGTLVWQWSSDAFGNGAPNEDPDGDGTAITLNLRFPGQYYDAESGMHYNWNRYYDPEIGRYITSDPIGLDGGVNTYTYVESNPVIRTDTSGLLSDTATNKCKFDPFICTLMADGLKRGTRSSSIPNSKSDTKQCEDDGDDEDCKDRISDWRLRQQGIDAHELKYEYLGSRASIKLFELCKCRDGTVSIRRKGCAGPVIRTWVVIK